MQRAALDEECGALCILNEVEGAMDRAQFGHVDAVKGGWLLEKVVVSHLQAFLQVLWKECCRLEEAATAIALLDFALRGRRQRKSYQTL